MGGERRVYYSLSKGQFQEISAHFTLLFVLFFLGESNDEMGGRSWDGEEEMGDR